jgi:hypothetical protein
LEKQALRKMPLFEQNLRALINARYDLISGSRVVLRYIAVNIFEPPLGLFRPYYFCLLCSNPPSHLVVGNNPSGTGVRQPALNHALEGKLARV